MLPSPIESSVADDQLFLAVIYWGPPPMRHFSHVRMQSLANFIQERCLLRKSEVEKDIKPHESDLIYEKDKRKFMYTSPWVHYIHNMKIKFKTASHAYCAVSMKKKRYFKMLQAKEEHIAVEEMECPSLTTFKKRKCNKIIYL